MKKTVTIIALVCFYLSVSAQTPVQTNGALSVSGNRIVNKNGNAVSFAGNSLFWTNKDWGGEKFYNTSVVNWLYSDWKATIVRVPMGVDESGGYLSDPSNKDRVKTIVDAAISKGIYVIIDWHSHHAENYQTQAVQFFKEMATLYGNYDNVIYEIYNEPLGSASWSGVIKPYALTVIAAIRAIDNNNLIIVGTPNWSQDVDVASNNKITGYSNIAYTLHFYAGTHTQSLRNKAQTALNNGIAIMVTEWGTVNADGNGAVATAETNLWMDFLCTNKISHCNWAINDKNEGASALKQGSSTTGNWTASNLTASGTLVKDIVKNWNSNCNTTGITNINKDIVDFELYPNPADDVLSINVNNNVQLLSATIFNVLGAEVLSIKNPTNKLDLSTMNAGVYFVTIKTNMGTATKRLMVK